MRACSRGVSGPIVGLLTAFSAVAGAQVREAPLHLPEPRGFQAVGISAHESPRPQESGIANFRGIALPYVVVDGMAVHAGDMVLGRAIDLESSRADMGHSPHLAPPPPRHLAPADDKFLWPGGIIPYVIDAEIPSEQVDKILEAVREWNEKTVISLQPRDTQVDYARFQATGTGLCRADVGMVGGEQSIYVPPIGCSVSTLIHEIGHAVGLYHEHQREDRDAHIMVFDQNIDQRLRHNFSARHPGVGPYDYASTMHYRTLSTASRNGQHMFETIPPGLHIPSSGLSQGDIDSIARLYGENATATTISTNPQGLEILVDGQRLTAPINLNWVSGSTHVIEAPIAQIGEGSRYLFGKWSSGENRRHEVIANPDTTWIEANFIVQHKVETSASPAGSGYVHISPSSPDGYYTERTAVEAVATPSNGSEESFLWWNSIWNPWGLHGRNSNPASLVIDGPGKVFDSVFTHRPQFRIETGGAVVRIEIDDSWDYGPTVRLADTENTELRIGVAEVLAPYGQGGFRYRFQGWSDGGARSHTVALPSQGGSIRAMLAAEFPLSTAVADPSSGSISVDPPSIDGYYRAGTPVGLTASPSPGWEFVGWTADISALEPAISVEMDSPKHVEAVFSRTRELALGIHEPVTLPSTNYTIKVHDRENGFRVLVPPRANELRIDFLSTTPGAEVDLYVNAKSEVLHWSYDADGKTPRFEAEAWSARPGSSEQVVVALESKPAFEAPRLYFISLVVHSPRVRIEGTLRASFRQEEAPSPIPFARPRALTFVAVGNADATAQVIQLENLGDAPWRYRIDSDQAWLVAAPNLGTIAAGASSELSVKVTGAGIAPDTHNATLRLAPLDSTDVGAPEPLEIPVTFVAVPVGAGTNAAGDSGVTARPAN